ncbi:MAG: DNA repair protein RecO [Peptococcaceae bacterium]|nr:DNA repair protein RecO [Peptococcaceae bacterium]
MAVYSTDAIVIRSRDYAEADKIITLFSQDLGKIQAIAKGARKPKSKLRGGIQLFTYAAFQLYKGKSLDTVTQVEPKESFFGLLTDLERLSYANYMAELVDAAVLENENGQEIFLLTLTCLYLLQASTSPKVVIRSFELKLLQLLGYQPQVEECLGCGQTTTGGKNYLSAEMGGVICHSCRHLDMRSWEISGGTLAVLKHLLQIDLRKLDRLKIPFAQEEELARLNKQFLGCKLEKRFKSLDILAKL